MKRAALLVLFLLAAACWHGRPHLRLATTTSTDNSGLLDYLLPAFERECDCRVDVIAVGTGKALRLGMNGDADVLLVHDPQREREFVARGYGRYRREVMTNDFVIVGPPADPAGVRHASTLEQALRRIARARVPFLSRGDESGTHARERALWKLAGVRPAEPNYRETGLGMGATLQIASETGAYTLSDRSTFAFMREGLALEIVFEGDDRLLNHYSVIPVSRSEARSAALAERFARWIVGPEAQARIAAYRPKGDQLFYPVRPAAAREP